MTQVYLMKLFKPSSEVYAKMLDMVGEDKRDKLLNIKRNETQLQTLLAEILLRVILCAQFGFENENIFIERDLNGKPYLSNGFMNFNISHSKSWMAVVISDCDVGVDLEKIRDVNLKLTDRYFTKKEKEYINVDSPDWQIRFFEVWTKKEAFLKMSGLGIRTRLDELETEEITAVKTYSYEELVLSVCCEDLNIKIFNNEECYSIIYNFFGANVFEI